MLGLDLSGPTNTADTAAAWFGADAGELAFRGRRTDLDDHAILELVASFDSGTRIVVGIDAPLSYNSGGGDRPADRALRRRAVVHGLPSGSVMTPTMTRMAYLTLRGVCVARALEISAPGIEIVEVHPGAAMALRGASVGDVRALKSDASARRSLTDWLGQQGIRGLPDAEASDHMVAAYACALAAWAWASGRSAWVTRATGASNPYDYAC